MKIVLDLDHSINNYHWEDKEKLKQHIYNMLSVLWEYYQDYIQEDNDPSDGVYVRFYDILDMFSKFEIIEKEQTNDNIDNNITYN